MNKNKMNVCRNIGYGLAVVISLAVDANQINEIPEDVSNIIVKNETYPKGVTLFSSLVGYWGFDNAESPFEGYPRGGTLKGHDELPEHITNDKIMGSGAAHFGASQALKLDPLPSSMTEGKSFTVTFWHKAGANASNKGFLLSLYGSDKQLFRLQYNGKFEEMKFNTTSIPVSFAFEWTHFAIVFDYAVNRYQLYTNGVVAATTSKPPTVPADGVLYLGNLDVRDESGSRYITDGLFDEFAIFATAMTARQIGVQMSMNYPLDFSATWEVRSSGSLTVPGGCVQDFRGSGSVSSLFGLTFENSAADVNRLYSGTIGGPSLSLSSNNKATLTLSGENAYSGRTTVSGGRLAVSSATAGLQQRFGSDLSAYWPFDGTAESSMLNDLSGNENSLTATDELSSCIESSANEAFAGRSVWFKGGQPVNSGLKPAIALTGFASGTDNPYTVSMWVKVAADCNSDRAGFWKTDNGSGSQTGMRIVYKDGEACNSIVFGDMGVFQTPTLSLGDAETSLVGGDWHHFVQTYDTETKKTSFYFDGKFVAEGGSAEQPHFGNSKTFSVGLGVQASSRGEFKGWIDEVVVLHRHVTADDVMFLYGYRRAAPLSQTDVLPATTVLDVASGAAADFLTVNENIAGLEGSGAIFIDSSSRLAISGTIGYTGTVTGSGVLSLGSNLTWSVPVDDKGLALPGTHTFFTVPTASLQEYSSKDWTVSGQGNRTVTFVAQDNGDDTTIFVVSVVQPGFMLLFR
ncbi:MAG: autotransporter-associated beta strand repeat-containing protein [Verrucomicrobiota bacterium]|nr:autotransporter-associated beta strand repeat-containing protein [Verrucomicrobiota bacterium]